ncbi:ABC transporter permease [Brevibacillus ruminantium]|uniref:ABC transporter permease n=1 Tax=Brevibacillus ruminantium TaxID=2950604 RepID=A0ABY4WDQ1_9BACL|nr:ABC transporter permease [Brevibacillus ruminantium]USG64874.1 ABC transporter permease [Brevibacillus ruminantium]
MNFWEAFRTAIEGIWANKMRSGLTMLGIVIGITSVITVNTLGEGGQKALSSEMEKFGKNNFDIFVFWDTKEERSPDDLTVEDAETLTRISPYIEQMAPLNQSTSMIKGPKKEEKVNVYATTSNYLDIASTIKVNKGRFFSETDDKELRGEIVIEDALAKKLFGQMNPIGQRVKMDNNKSLVVIGTFVEEKFRFDNSDTYSAYIPIRYDLSFYKEPSISMLVGKAVDDASVNTAMKQANQYLSRKHKKEIEHYFTRSMQDSLQSFNQFTGTLTMIFSVIAGISLIVGGVGVMNIMLVSVTERTREIGIRKALGARRRDILMQFLIESVIVCLISGLIGVLLGLGAAALVSYFAKMPPLLSWNSIITAFGFSSAIGIFFGLYPANKAAKLDPIEALRYE